MVPLSMLYTAEEDDQCKLAHAAVAHVANTNFALRADARCCSLQRLLDVTSDPPLAGD